VGAGIGGAAASFVLRSLAIAIISAIIGFAVMIFAGTGGLAGGRRGGVWIPSSGGWGGGGFGGGSGGGGFSGGGGGFGGGGSSGNW